MEAAQIDPILLATLADTRLSRSERRQLKAHLTEMRPDDSAIAYIRNRAFELGRAKLAEEPVAAGDVIDWLEDVAKTLAAFQSDTQPNAGGSSSVNSALYLSPGDECLRALLGLIKRATKSIDVCVFTVTDDRITEELFKAHERKVRLRIVTDNDKSEDRGSDVEKIIRAGIPLRMDRTDHHMHHKFAVFDAGVVATGSYNWTRSAAKYNRENIAVTDEAHLVKAYDAAFEKIWSQLTE